MPAPKEREREKAREQKVNMKEKEEEWYYRDGGESVLEGVYKGEITFGCHPDKRFSPQPTLTALCSSLRPGVSSVLLH